MTDKHTPGPWNATDGAAILAGSGINIQNIASVSLEKRLGRGSAKADALLISAAPDLLAALRAARPYVMTCVDEPIDPAGRALAALDAAIAKAEGRS